MISTPNRLARWAAALVLAGVSSFASAAPVCNGGSILANCSFEAAFPGSNVVAAWTLSNSNVKRLNSIDITGTDALDGDHFMQGSGDNGNGTIGQTLDLKGSKTGYLIDFWLNFTAADGIDGRFTWSLDDSDQAIVLGATESGWQQITGIIAAMPNDYEVDLMFSFVDTSASVAMGGDERSTYIFLDNVSVVARAATINVPEPGSLLLVGMALAAGAIVRRRKSH